MGILEKIKEIEAEMARTQKNKGNINVTLCIKRESLL
jgi:ribosome-interacting GTPase 1